MKFSKKKLNLKLLQFHKNPTISVIARSSPPCGEKKTTPEKCKSLKWRQVRFSAKITLFVLCHASKSLKLSIHLRHLICFRSVLKIHGDFFFHGFFIVRPGIFCSKDCASTMAGSVRNWGTSDHSVAFRLSFLQLEGCFRM